MLVGVKSARDKLSVRQRTWFSELMQMSVTFEKFKNVYKKNSINVAAQLTCVEFSILRMAKRSRFIFSTILHSSTSVQQSAIWRLASNANVNKAK